VGGRTRPTELREFLLALILISFEEKAMKYLQCALVACLLFAIAGCGTVYTTSPVGETPTQLVAEEWDGTWLGNGGTLELQVLDEMEGTLEAVLLGEQRAGEWEIWTVVAHVRTWKNWMFLTGEDLDEEGQYRYSWIGRIKKDDEQIILWGPDLGMLSRLVSEGKLPGRVRSSDIWPTDVFLDELRPEDLELIRDGDEGMVLEWEDPYVLIRIVQR